MWGWHDWSWGWWLVMSLGMLAIWLAVACFAVGAAHDKRPDRRSPEAVLADRLARGEIDTEEHRQRLDVLRQTPGRAA